MKVQLSSAASNPLGCPDWVGMTVRLAPEWVSALDRNQCPECVGICNYLTLPRIMHTTKQDYKEGRIDRAN